MSQEEAQPKEKQRKRSKRHRTNRNHISDKERINSVKEFGVISRQWEKDYRNRYPKKQTFNPFGK